MNPALAAVSASSCFALLDDAQSAQADSRLYHTLHSVLECRDPASWPQFMQQLEQALQQGLYAISLLSYETGAELHGVAAREQAPLSRILLFSDCQHLTSQQVQDWLQQQPESRGVAGIAGIRANVDEASFSAAIAQVQDYIRAGDTYQVNYTYRLHFDSFGEPLALYQRLRARQPVPYGALIRLPDGGAILSMSPELFIRHQDGQLLARPMKGTAAATGDATRDAQIAAELAADSKNRAENLMIVDLLRNDLGRIAETGSVTVPRLFEVNRFSSVLQMTSTIQAQLRSGLALTEVLTALFPCGSITGAPKRRTMQIIRELETEARGIYTGAIGWFDPPSASQAIGDFCLSVPIRTLQLAPPELQQGRQIRRSVMGVGAGIVYDSVATEEFAECQLKARFLTGLQAPLALFETMYATREQGVRHLQRHLQRLQHSAAYFGIAQDLAGWQQALEQACAGLAQACAHRVKFQLQPDGSWTINSAALSPLPDAPKVLVSPHVMQSDQLLLRHKTSCREVYDQAWQAAEAQGAFDMLFFNQHGHLTEGGRSNVFLCVDGQWLTPPLQDGLLPGVMRSVLLEDAQLAAREQTLTRADLQRARHIMLCNALRGAFSVQLISAEVKH
ncbi:aminodeoxychorismate synthase component I [Undibacterium curvum]|uniref:aminodeoxychorismate synthase component I n=1 Tax=Undibacterium curvum TaxID=2762294 RepID=UPI003D0A1082